MCVCVCEASDKHETQETDSKSGRKGQREEVGQGVWATAGGGTWSCWLMMPTLGGAFYVCARNDAYTRHTHTHTHIHMRSETDRERARERGEEMLNVKALHKRRTNVCYAF